MVGEQVLRVKIIRSSKKHAICVYPCPCGYFSDPERQCTCSLQTVTRYQKRISGPMLDRIDIHIEVPRVDFEKLSDSRRGESSDAIRARVEVARQRQRARFAGLNNGVMTNADMRVAEVRQFCELDEAGQQFIKAAMDPTSTLCTRLPPHPEVSAYHREFGWGREYPIHAFGGGVAVPPQGNDGVAKNLQS